MCRARAVSLTLALTFCALGVPQAAHPQAKARPAPASSPADRRDVDELVALQVALDRARFSPGEIDGHAGVNTVRALATFRSAKGLAAGTAAAVDPETRAALQPWIDQPLSDYVVGEADVAGPFAPLPADLMEQAALPALGYASPLELIAERFHAAPAPLTALNPSARFVAGETLRVPNVEPMTLPATSGAVAPKGAPAAAAVIEVVGAEGQLRVRRGQELLLVAPVTVGSERDPLPVGEWTVTDVFLNPIFNYNPDLFWDADERHAKARLAAGPNNPVGPVWVGLDKQHYGIHGTPSPQTVGHTQSHGCIRLTNWDALTLASLVRKGSRVVLR